ncbi:TetR/AcrR family transcriptional regulator [Pandoraea commovens]|uniref:TetR family transcriptional regulator n=1 Tax=Pandoraea commovens TaxID=2508289 RepID=A0A5E4RKR9_9BURK|nr:TetR/AcrR family transcriptional regulator [Pandoraea commovens]UVA81938.1 TetR/AcrR family transcriptional regulator [Pandoraea commovens]VVD63022.1 TetR family transcriptional regulator [Pandoraea commovens]
MASSSQPADLSAPQLALLDTTERLVYAGGIHATGVDAIVRESGVVRKTLYRHYPTKEALVEAALLRRDERWMQWFVASTSQTNDPVERLQSCFDALRTWFASDGFHGCAFLNAAGEIGDPASGIRSVSKLHKQRLLDYLSELTTASGLPQPDALAGELLILIDGAISVALVFGGTEAADTAARVARRLLAVS